MNAYTPAEILAAFPPVEKLEPVYHERGAPELKQSKDDLLEALTVLGKRSDGAYDVLCPFAEEHTSKHNGTDCVYYPAHTGGYTMPKVHCLHAHCANRTLDEYKGKLGLPVSSSPQLTLVGMGDVMTANLPVHEFVVAQWIPRRLVTLLAGHGGMGKSYLALVLAAHVAAGENFAGLHVTQGRVLFVSLEDEPRLVRWRLRKIIEVYNLDGQKVLDNLALLDGTEQFTPLITMVSEGANAQPFFTKAHETVRQHAVGHALVVIDNASDAFDANENVRRHVRQFVHGLSSCIARESDAAVLLLAHIDKNAAKFGANGNSYSGSTAWHNSCRSRLALVDEGGQLSCTHEKMNLGPLADPVPISFGPHGVPMVGESMLDNEETDEEDREALRACFQAAEAAQLTVGARMEPGNGSAMSALQTLPCYPQRFRSTGGKRKVPQLLNAMKADGTLEVVEYTSNRNQRRKLVLSNHAKEQGDGQKPCVYRTKTKRVVSPPTPPAY